jgi:hypothetical protein
MPCQLTILRFHFSAILFFTFRIFRRDRAHVLRDRRFVVFFLLLFEVFTKLSAPKIILLLDVPGSCQFAASAVSLTDFHPGHRFPAFASNSKQAVGLWKTISFPQFRHFLRFRFVPLLLLLPELLNAGGLFSLLVVLPLFAMIAFILSNIVSIAFWFNAAIASICDLC